MNMLHNPLSIEARAYAALKAKLAEAFNLDEDDEAISDTAEGQSSLHEMIISSIRYAQRRAAYAEGLSAVIADNRRRQQRHEKAAENIRVAVAQAMEEANLPKIEASDLTITRRIGKPGLAITDESALPDWAVRIKREPNKAILNERYKLDPENFSCPGVTVANGLVGITVLSK